MAMSRNIPRKAPAQAPKDFYELKQTGGPHGGQGMAPEKSTSGPLREKIWGKKELSK